MTTVRVTLALAGLLSSAAYAQFGRGGAEWVTNGSDAQRSYSIPLDGKISPQSLAKPGFEFLWKSRLNNESVQLNSLTPAILMDRYIGYRGFRSFAFVAGSANMVYAIDSDLSRIEWRKRLSGAVPPPGSLTCPGGLTANIARATSAAYPTPVALGAGLGGRGGPARSDVSQPREGAVTIGPALAAMAAAANAPGRGQQLRFPTYVYVVAGDGKLHSLYISNGEEPQPPVDFLPPNANAQGLIVVDEVVYVSTASCGGAPSGVWGYDLQSRRSSNWKPGGNAAIAGLAGPAFGPDGTVYATTTSGELVALESKTLKLNGSYRAATGFSSPALVFPFKERNLVTAGAKDGRIHLVDTVDLGGGASRKPLFVTAPFSAPPKGPTALASWQSPDGSRWLLAAFNGTPSKTSGFSRDVAITNGAVAAWKLVETNGALALEPAWVSRNLVSPAPPIVINGVVFALSTGEFQPGDKKMAADEIAERSVPAVLYAFDIATGKSLWDSGKTITSFVHSGGVTGGAGQVYLQTYDQTLYTFGYYLEH